MKCILSAEEDIPLIALINIRESMQMRLITGTFLEATWIVELMRTLATV